MWQRGCDRKNVSGFRLSFKNLDRNPTKQMGMKGTKFTYTNQKVEEKSMRDHTYKKVNGLKWDLEANPLNFIMLSQKML